MANRNSHRRFGSIRKRESGRYQIRYIGPDGQTHTGPETLERKSDAERTLKGHSCLSKRSCHPALGPTRKAGK
jgi:hypothetical protein